MRRSTITSATFAALQNLSCGEARQGQTKKRQVSDPHEVADVPSRKASGKLFAILWTGASMATPALNSRVQSLVTEYGVFWQFWPQFEQTHGERRLVGFEVELIGSHTSDPNHLDLSCPACRHVRSVLLAIADLMPGELTHSGNSLTYNIDSHSNSIICMPALGNRSAVWVSIYVFLNRANGQSIEMDLLNGVKTFLYRWGIHQR